MKRFIIFGAGLVLLMALGLLLPRWLRDPRELVLGDWQESQKLGTVTVEREQARWEGMGRRITIPYRWIQAESEPYELEFRYRGETLRTELRFNGDGEAVLSPHITDKLPASARRALREQNRAHGRPDDEFNILFRRLKPEKSR